MSALHYLSWLACAIGFIFVLLSLASGLLYVAEVIEEHSGLAKTVGKRLIYAEIALYCLLYWVDDLPIHLVALGIAAHLVYLGNFSRSWPVISLTSISFVLSCVCVLASHFLSFRHFSARTASHNRYTHYNAYNRHNGHGSGEPTFLDIATFFAVCVWLVPFYLFLSLSANDNVLPSSGETPAPSRRQSAAAGAPSSAAAPTISHRPASPALSSAPSSPNLSRHTRQRSSMMKSALSSAFSIVPSSLRPSTLSSQLPLLSAPGGIGQGQGARNDLPRSPSPTFGFRPYEGQPAFSSALSLNNLSALGASSGPGGSTSPKKPTGWGGQTSVPTSPTSTTTGLGFSTATLPSGTERGSGGALASPSLSHSTSQGRMLNFAPSPQPSPSAASFPHSPSTPSFYSPPPGQGFSSSAGGGGGLAAPGMARRHTTEQGFVAPPVPLGERRASEAVVTIGGAGGAEAGGAYGGPVKRRGPGGAGGGGGRV
ncbi:hypothetical protein JCM8097_009261 [Rhodosporidiobolus ruineniae]